MRVAMVLKEVQGHEKKGLTIRLVCVKLGLWIVGCVCTTSLTPRLLTKLL
jgi:hypothetical protein